MFQLRWTFAATTHHSDPAQRHWQGGRAALSRKEKIWSASLDKKARPHNIAPAHCLAGASFLGGMFFCRCWKGRAPLHWCRNLTRPYLDIVRMSCAARCLPQPKGVYPLADWGLKTSDVHFLLTWRCNTHHCGAEMVKYWCLLVELVTTVLQNERVERHGCPAGQFRSVGSRMESKIRKKKNMQIAALVGYTQNRDDEYKKKLDHHHFQLG